MIQIDPLAYTFKVKIDRDKFINYCDFYGIKDVKEIKKVARDFRERGYQLKSLAYLK